MSVQTNQPEIKLSKALSEIVVDISEQSATANIGLKNLGKSLNALFKYAADKEAEIEALTKQNKELADTVIELKKKIPSQ